MSEVSNVSKPFRIFVAIAMTLLGAHFIWQLAHSKLYSLESLSDLRTEFMAIPPPVGAFPTSDVRAASKVTFQTVSADFQAPSSAHDLIAYYKTALSTHGWTEKAEQRQDGRLVTYCKMDLDAIVEIVESKAGATRFYFGVSRQDGPRVSSGC